MLLVVKWFPAAIFLSLMCMPRILDYSAFKTTFMPSMFLLWVLAIVYVFEVRVQRLPLFLLGLLIAGQWALWLTGQVHDVESMLLGLIWVCIAFMVYQCMPCVKQYTNIYLNSFVVVAVLWAVVAGIVWLGFTDGDQITIGQIAVSHIAQPKPAGSFTNGNVFGIMMLCAWIIAFHLWESKPYRFWLSALMFFFLVWIFASMSRGAWVALFAISIFIFIALIKAGKWKKVLLLLLVFYLAWWLADTMVGYVLHSVDLSSRVEKIVSINARLSLYPAAFEIWREHWFLGVGLGNFIAHFLTGQALAHAYLPLDLYGMGATASAHNHLLHVLATAGLVGFVVWFAIAVVLFRGLWKVGINLHHPAWVLFAVPFVLWVQGLFNITMTEALPFFIFFMFLGLGNSFIYTVEKGYTIPRKAFLFATVLVMIPLSSYSYTTVQAWRTLETAIFDSKTAQERGKYVSKLFAQENLAIYPYLTITIVHDSILRNRNDAQYWRKIKPVIELALRIQEAPELYQGLFYSEVVNHNWEVACKLGKFLILQHWEKDKNQEAYKSACQGKLPKDFSIGWQ